MTAKCKPRKKTQRWIPDLQEESVYCKEETSQPPVTKCGTLGLCLKNTVGRKTGRFQSTDLWLGLGLSTDKMVKEMAKIILHLIMILLNRDAMKIQNVIFIVKVQKYYRTYSFTPLPHL